MAAGEETTIPVIGGLNVEKIIISPFTASNLESLEIIACTHRPSTTAVAEGGVRGSERWGLR